MQSETMDEHCKMQMEEYPQKTWGLTERSMWSRASNRQHPSVAELDESIQTFTGSRCELKSFWIVADIHIQSKNILHIISDPKVYQKAIQSPITKCFVVAI